MFAKKYLEQQLRRTSAGQINLPTQLSELRQLASLRQLLILTPELLLTPYELRRTYPIAGQTDAHRSKVLAMAAYLANLDPDPLYKPLRAASSADATGYVLVVASEFSRAVGLAVGTVIQQISSAGGEAILLCRDQEILAVFDMYRSAKPDSAAVCLQLQGLGIRLLRLDDHSFDGLTQVETVSILADSQGADGGLLRLDERIILSVPGTELSSMTLDRFADLPIALERARRLVRPLFWLPNSTA